MITFIKQSVVLLEFEPFGLNFYFVHQMIHTIVIHTSVNRIWSEAHWLILTISIFIIIEQTVYLEHELRLVIFDNLLGFYLPALC